MAEAPGFLHRGHYGVEERRRRSAKRGLRVLQRLAQRAVLRAREVRLARPASEKLDLPAVTQTGGLTPRSVDARGIRLARWLRRNAVAFLVLIPLLIYLPAIMWWSLPGQFAVVMSGSMEPAFSVADLVILKPARDIQVGDVVAFDAPSGAAGFPSRVLHRVVAVDEAGARLTTKVMPTPTSTHSRLAWNRCWARPRA